MSQGRSGSMATIHADSSAGVFRRLASYAVQAPERLPLEATNLLIAGSVHLVVHLDTVPELVDGHQRQVEDEWPPRQNAATRRVVSSVREVVDAEGPLVVSNEVWRPGAHGRAVPGAPPSEPTISALAAAGYEWPGVSPTAGGRW
jgi:Flp pilus assembly CpaF family ATPase